MSESTRLRASAPGAHPTTRPQEDLRSFSDDRLLTRIVARDPASLNEVIARHGGVMAAVARRALGDAAAEDVVQDVFTRLWQAPHRFDSVRGPLRSFLILQVRSRTIDVQRTDSARRAREDRDGANDQRTRAPASAALDELYSHETLGTLLHGLVRDEREPIRLAFFEGYTYREVAALLDVPEGTVKSRIRAGLQRLRSALDVDDAAAAAPQT